jgi:murein DD-endopeptidase MepM/ murein hydrolase activator NlpD
MRHLTLSLLLLLSCSMYAQQEPANYKAEAAVLLKAYQEGTYKDFFDTYNPDMRTHLPLEKTTTVFTGIKTQFGSISSFEFMEMKKGAANYKAVFEQGTLNVKLTLDSNNQLAGLLFEPYTSKEYPILVRNKTKLILPFNGEWFVAWGGDTKELNQHVESRQQKNAFDLVVIDDKFDTHTGDGTKNEDYYAFGKEIIAPCDAVVIDVVDGVRDNIPGEMNTMFVPGNWVQLKTANDEYLFFAHFKQHSIRVKEGQKVKKGELLGLCGNSGNSSEAHLHFHIQNTDDYTNATGTKVYFDKITVTDMSGTKQRQEYSPIKNDRIKN